MNVRELRFATAVALMAICAFAVMQGATLVHFRLATDTASSDARQATLRPWYSVPGIGALAREADLPLKLDTANRDNLARQRDSLAAYLAVRPAASLQWLMLAAGRLLLGAPAENVVSAYGLSVATGPNENDVIVERSKFGLYLWNDLPPELKKREIDDLALGFFSGEEKINLRKLFAAMTAASRQEILNALPKPRIAVLGFES